MNVTCNRCNWVSFAVTKAYAEQQVEEFNKYYDSLPVEEQEMYYGGRKSGLHNYTCQLCGGLDFRKSEPGDCPDGCTIGSVICDELADK